MEQFCFLNNFPDTNEDRFYKLVGADSNTGYTVYAGGTFIFIKNPKGHTIRFTSPEIKNQSVSPEKIEKWISRLQQLYTWF